MSTAPNSTIFRLSPLATWHKVLGRKPGLDHYTISNEAKSLAGMGSLQRWGRHDIGGRGSIPILAHSQIWPIGRGGQFASATSEAFWFDGPSGSLTGTCSYADNRSQLAVFMGRDSRDWIVSEPDALTLPPHPITVDFVRQDTYFSTSWTECRKAMAETGGTGQGSAYARGPLYQPSGMTIERKATVETGGVPGLVGYRFATRITYTDQPGSEPEEQSVCFWVHTSNHYVQYLDITATVVSVNPDTREHTWIEQPCRWSRVA
jgi:hypothetical protein